jgi:hypothetical protein
MSKPVRLSSVTPGLGRVCLLLGAIVLGLGGAAAADTPPSLSFSPVTDDIGTAGERETRLLITSPSDYERYFGHPAPEGIDWSRQWLVFYSAGVQSTGGYEAQIERIFVTGRVLHVVTVLVRPGENCIVTQALSKPHVMVVFDRPKVPVRHVRFSEREEVRNCDGGSTSACAAVLCLTGTRCEEVDGEARCIPIATCGGLRGLTCPGAGRCVDDPNDRCELGLHPDCSGMCVCDALAKCLAGYRFDNSPAVCSCVPDEQSAGVTCGSRTCPAGQVCCNASCGIFTPPGGVCIQVECR